MPSATSGGMENMLLAILPKRRFPAALRYGATCAIIGVAALARAVLDGVLPDYPLLLFIPAVFLSALLFDRGSGFFATVVSAALAAYVFIPPQYSFAIGWSQVLPLALFTAIGFTMAAVTEALRQSVHRLAAAERSKTLLLEELAHRTRNDLTLIISALNLQARGEQEPAVRAALEAAIARVNVIAQAQDRLRGNDDGGGVELAAYLQGLCEGLGNLLRDVRPIAVRLTCEPMTLNSSQAVVAGLIVNELVTNAFKYAFPDGAGGAVEVRVSRDSADGLRIMVEDDGAGCQTDALEGLGSRLVRLLAGQYKGSVRREPAEPGCRVIVTLCIDGR